MKALGMQTCHAWHAQDGQAEKLKEAGLDYYNHKPMDTDKVLRPGHQDSYPR